MKILLIFVPSQRIDQLVKILLIFVPSQRIENRWTSDGKMEFFPLVLIQVKSAAKRTVFGLKNKREKAFLPFKTQLFHIQVIRYAASNSSPPLSHSSLHVARDTQRTPRSIQTGRVVSQLLHTFGHEVAHSHEAFRVTPRAGAQTARARRAVASGNRTRACASTASSGGWVKKCRSRWEENLIMKNLL